MINTADFDHLCQILKNRSGLIITQEKGYLLESRLNPLARDNGVADYAELAAKLRATNDEKLINQVVDAMTTNESFFFRDQKPFDLFRQSVLPYMMQSRAANKSFRIWCAACSSGQEPYSIAMLLSEQDAALHGWKIDIIATDISPTILTQARNGRFSQFEVQRGLPVNLLVKYFQQDGAQWQIQDTIKSRVQFKEFNLLNNPSSLGRFDVVFCRNVLIYFDAPTKGQVLDRIAGCMADDGVLYLGGAETVLNLSDAFVPMQGQRGLYSRKQPEGQRHALAS